MPRYADPTACPDCGGPIGPDASRCGRCGLVLAGPTAVELYWTLQRADELLTALRASSPPATAPATAARAAPVTTTGEAAPVAATAAFPGAGGGHPQVTIPPLARPSAPRRRRLSGASVPRILLGLGALCLVVAALVFMVVTWARLGVGGRTVVLVAATAAAAAVSVWAARRSLPGVAEALTVVAVALGALDAFGAADAGWFGDLDGGTTTIVVGVAIAAVSVLLGVLHELLSAGTGRAEQALVAVGCAAIAGGALMRADEASVVLAVATTVLLALAYAARRAGLPLAALCLLLVALASGLALLGIGLAQLGEGPLSFSHTLLHGGTEDLLVLGALGVVAASLPDLPRSGRTASAVVGLGLLGFALTAFLLDEGPTGVGGAAAGLAVLAGLASVVARAPWRLALRLLTLLWSTVAAVVAVRLALAGAERYLEAHRWLAESPLAPAAAHTAPDRWVGLLVVPPLVVVALIAATSGAASTLRDRARPGGAAVVGAAALGAYAAAAVVPTPLAVLTAAAGAVALGAAVLAARVADRGRSAVAVGAHVAGGVATAVSYPAPGLLLAGALVWAAACGVLVLGGPGRLSRVLRGATSVVWVVLAVPAALALDAWLPPVAGVLLVAAAAALVTVGSVAVLSSGVLPVAGGLAGAAVALAAAAVSVDPASGAALTWAALALALAAAAGAASGRSDLPTGAPVGASAPGASSGRDLARVTAIGALVAAFLAAAPTVGATVARVAADPWSVSWRDRLPGLAEVSAAVDPAAQTALVGALVGTLGVLVLLLVSAPSWWRTVAPPGSAPDADRSAGPATPVDVPQAVLLAAAGALTGIGWMFLPSRSWLVAVGVVLAVAAFAGPRVLRSPGQGRPRRRTPLPTAVGALVLLAVTTVAAAPSQVLFVAATAAATLALAWLSARGHVAWAAPAAVVVGAACLVSGTLAAGAPRTWSATPVLAVAAVAVVLAAVRRRTFLPVEAAFSVAVVGASAVAVDEAGATPWAAHLAVVGALAAGHGASHADRRGYAWAGSVLLAASTWVRLADAEVSTVEAYTLPSALALVALGLWRLHRDGAASSARALGSGLLLATLPSVPQVWDDPVSLRALLLGLGCLAMVLVGAARSLAAPLLAGAAVGAVVVLAEVWPVIGSGPQWVPLTLAGLVLLVCGATWEARMRDLRRAGAYLAALR